MAWVHLLLNNGHLPPVFTNVLHNHVLLGLLNVLSVATRVGRHIQSNINDTYNALDVLRVASNMNFPSDGVACIDISDSSGTNAREQSHSSSALQDSRHHSSAMTGNGAFSGKNESKRSNEDH